MSRNVFVILLCVGLSIVFVIASEISMPSSLHHLMKGFGIICLGVAALLTAFRIVRLRRTRRSRGTNGTAITVMYLVALSIITLGVIILQVVPSIAFIPSLWVFVFSGFLVLIALSVK